jgi:hypothetical protein
MEQVGPTDTSEAFLFVMSAMVYANTTKTNLLAKKTRICDEYSHLIVFSLKNKYSHLLCELMRASQPTKDCLAGYLDWTSG